MDSSTLNVLDKNKIQIHPLRFDVIMYSWYGDSDLRRYTGW